MHQSVPPEIVPFSTSGNADRAAVHREGIRVRLLCGLARGDLPVSFSWLKDGLHVGGLEGVTVTEVDAFSSLLTFSRLGRRHSGNYTCVAENDAGSDSHTVSLTVKGIAWRKCSM